VGHAAGDADRRADEPEALIVSGRTFLAAATLVVAASTPASAQSWRTITSARQLHGERQLDVRVQYGVGRFQLVPGAADDLYRMELRYDEDKFVPVRAYDAEAGVLRLGVRSRDGSGLNVRLGDRSRRDDPMPMLNLSLTRDIPLTLSMELGAVEADVELGGLALHRVELRTGASTTQLRFSRPNPVACDEMQIEAGAAAFNADNLASANCARIMFTGGLGDVTLDFGGDWRRSMAGDVNVGLGTLHLRLPRGVGVEMHMNRLLASFDAAGFVKRGGTYFSENFDGAQYRLTLDVSASLGGVEITWVDE